MAKLKRGRERVFLAEGDDFCSRCGHLDGCASGYGKGIFAYLVQIRNDDAEPLFSRVFVVNVAVNSRCDTLCTEFFEAGVEKFSHLAKVDVVGVPKSQDRKF